MTALHQRMIEVMRLWGPAATTQCSYLHDVTCFADFFGTSPEHLDLEAIRQYAPSLLNEAHLSPESVSWFLAAVKFHYLVTLEMP